MDDRKFAKYRLLAALLLICFVQMGATADTIDDAEAKRRGIPVEQVKLEGELANQIKRVRELEKEVAQLKEQIAALNAKLDGHPTTQPKSDTVSFFGINTKAKRVIFIVDHSGSMLDNFDFVKKETVRAVKSLDEGQSFAVVAFSNDVSVVSSIQLATDANKQLLSKSIQGVRAEGTNDNLLAPFQQAFEKAFSFKPDVVFFLTDGKFGDGLLPVVKKLNADRQVQINTVAFITEERDYKTHLETLAKENGGVYRFVPEKDLTKPADNGMNTRP